MKVKIMTAYEYAGKEDSPIEGCYLEVEGDIPDKPNEIADTYLLLRKKLKEGIKEES